MSEAEDETVPLLPSLEEEFDDGADNSKVTETKLKEGNYCQCSMRMVVLAVIGLTAVLLLIGAVIGIALAVVDMTAHKHTKSGTSSSFPVQTTSSNNNSSHLSTRFSSMTPVLSSISSSSVELSPSQSYSRSFVSIQSSSGDATTLQTTPSLQPTPSPTHHVSSSPLFTNTVL